MCCHQIYFYCSSNKTSTSTDVPRCTSKLSITQRVQQMSSCPNVKPTQPKSFQFYTYWHEPAFGKMNSRSGGWFHPPQCDSWWAVAPCFLLRRWSTSLGPVDESSCHDGEMKRPGFRYQRRHLSVVGKIRKKDKLNVSSWPTIYVCSNGSDLPLLYEPLLCAWRVPTFVYGQKSEQTAQCGLSAATAALKAFSARKLGEWFCHRCSCFFMSLSIGMGEARSVGKEFKCMSVLVRQSWGG